LRKKYCQILQYFFLCPKKKKNLSHVFIYIFRRFTLQQAVEMISNEDNDITGIYIEPPEPAVQSDEDSADEDTGGLIDNLTGRQLRSSAEVIFSDGRRLNDDDEADEGYEQQVELPQKPAKKKAKSVPKQTTWKKQDFFVPETLFPDSDYSSLRDISPVAIFELVFDDEILNLIVHETTRYALFLNMPDPKVTVGEMKVFLGILILSGYSAVPGKRLYWESAGDMRNELVYNAMRRERFVQIMRFLHFADNTKPDMADKMWKLRPLMKLLQNKFLWLFRPTKQLDYDESMVAYFGRHGCKQFIRGKPIRFGYKVWSLNTPSGYLVNFEVYQGKNPNANTMYDVEFGKAASPLVQMIDQLLPDHKHLPFHFYFDNLFTGMNLLRYLKGRGYSATGTIRDNRIPKDCPLTGKKEMQKKPRGSIDSIVFQPDNIILVRWVDNSVVTVASTGHGVEPVSTVQRYSQADKKVIPVSRPSLIGMYNKYMGGTDLMDENVSMYRIGIRGKKWWWPLFTWLIDVSVHNAWVLMKQTGVAMPQLEFRRQIAQTYLTRFKAPPKGPGRPSTSRGSAADSRVLDELRYDGLDHLVFPTVDSKRRRCAGYGCSSVGRTECRKCDVGLCISCFAEFHKRAS
jgi:hypothetical protein